MHRLLALLVLAGCGSTASDPAPAAPSPEPVEAAATDRPAVAARSVAELLPELDVQIQHHAGLGEANAATDWLHRKMAAELLMVRAKLSGTWDEYARAEELLAQGFAVAKAGTGPHLSRASLHLTLHRLSDAEADLAAVEGRAVVDEGTRGALAIRRAQLAILTGDLDGAGRQIEVARAIKAGSADLTTEGLLRLARGDLNGAEDRFRLAEGRIPPQDQITRAWLDLQAGLLDLERQRWADALVHYDDALAHLPGWYLAQEHRAEALAELGRAAEAVPIYRDVVARTESPELIGALAALVPEPERAELLARATAGWESRLALFPAAAGGHAIDHFVGVGALDRAEELARANHAIRPDAEGAGALATVLNARRQHAEALAVATAAWSRGYRRADLLEAAAEAATAVGDPSAAEFTAALATLRGT